MKEYFKTTWKTTEIDPDVVKSVSIANNVLDVGISFQIKYPNIIAQTNPRYFKGETKLTSEYL